jgi:hypothetical protein
MASTKQAKNATRSTKQLRKAKNLEATKPLATQQAYFRIIFKD